ncbi:MAG TPA: formate dehydrogenase accessory sulfurtransferase FdhD [Chthoniobacterales bacterium]|jgi:FdhD protein
MDLSEAERQGIGAGSVIRRDAKGNYEWVTDEVAVEEPLEIRIGQDPLAVTMRTPGNDEELAAGFLLSEGIVRARGDLREMAHCELPASLGNVLNVALAATAKFNPKAAHRFGTISTSCGLCGKTSIEFIRQQFAPIDSSTRIQIESAQLLALPERLREAQGNFSRTGGIHAAAIFDLKGNLVVIREDIGRHNAVDKAIGRAFLDSLLPLRNHVLLVSGRSSLEIVQKALAAGIPIVASVSAPSTLAVNFARESAQTLIGFLRQPTFNIYSHIERVALDFPANERQTG